MWNFPYAFNKTIKDVYWLVKKTNLKTILLLLKFLLQIKYWYNKFSRFYDRNCMCNCLINYKSISERFNVLFMNLKSLKHICIYVQYIRFFSLFCIFSEK